MNLPVSSAYYPESANFQWIAGLLYVNKFSIRVGFTKR